MNKDAYPKSREADICLLLEGTYPFLRGGVASWVDDIIRVFPQYTFAAVFLGSREEDYDGLQYALPENLVHLEVYYLFENNKPLEKSTKDIDKKTMQCIEKIHDKFGNFSCQGFHDMTDLFDLMEDSHMKESMFMQSKSAWNFIVKKYSENYPNQSFFDYFWLIRSLHRPFWDLAKIIDRLPRIKVLHSASTGYAGFLGAMLQKKFQIPHILTEHGIYAKERWIELMRNYFFDYVLKEHGQSEGGLLSIWMHFYEILSKIAYDSADPIISLIKEYQKRQIRDGALPERTRIIPYGLNFARYTFLDKKKPNQENPVIAIIGRVVPIKDIKTFIRAAALIIKKKPSAKIWVVGPTQEDQEYFETCKNLTESLGLQDKVEFLGVQKVMDIYPKIDVLVLSSISEGTPLVILESFAVGIPVVATDVGGCGELIYGKNPEDEALGAAGKLVNISDPDALAGAALELLADEALWLSAQQAGIARIKQYYSLEKFIENYGFIYEEALRDGGNRI